LPVFHCSATGIFLSPLQPHSWNIVSIFFLLANHFQSPEILLQVTSYGCAKGPEGIIEDVSLSNAS
jgi:hypothetical protein